LVLLSTGNDPDKYRDGLARLKDARDAYHKIEEHANVLERALLRLDDAMLLLPVAAESFAGGPADPAEERLWAATVTPTLKLQAVATPPARPQLPSLPELNSPLETLEYQLTELRGKFQSGAATALLQRANPAELRHALNSPLWSGPDRARMFAEANRLE